MPNYYTIITANERLKATSEEYNALKAAIETCNEEMIVANRGDDAYRCGFKVRYQGGRVFVGGFFEAGDVSDTAFLHLLGILIAKNDLEYLEFCQVITCYRPGAGGTGATIFRIRADGSMWDSTLTW
jgi:hypothetical protein